MIFSQGVQLKYLEKTGTIKNKQFKQKYYVLRNRYNIIYYRSNSND